MIQNESSFRLQLGSKRLAQRPPQLPVTRIYLHFYGSCLPILIPEDMATLESIKTIESLLTWHQRTRNRPVRPRQ